MRSSVEIGFASYEAREFPDFESAYRAIYLPNRYQSVQVADLDPRLAALPCTTNLYLTGPTGCGKTHQAWAWLLRCAIEGEAARHALHEAQQVRDYGEGEAAQRFYREPEHFSEQFGKHHAPQFFTASEMLQRKGASYRKGADEFTVSRRRMLVIDDLGAERSSEWSMDLLYDEINARYNDANPAYPLVVTSNLTPSQLRDKMDDRIVSRLIEMCGKHGIVKFEGDDRRLKLAMGEDAA